MKSLGNTICFVNDNFDKSIDTQEFNSNQKNNIDRQELERILDSIFHINNKYLGDFKISSNNQDMYDILFSK